MKYYFVLPVYFLSFFYFLGKIYVAFCTMLFTIYTSKFSSNTGIRLTVIIVFLEDSWILSEVFVLKIYDKFVVRRRLDMLRLKIMFLPMNSIKFMGSCKRTKKKHHRIFTMQRIFAVYTSTSILIRTFALSLSFTEATVWLFER